MNNLMTFHFETNEVRSIVIDGEAWFVGKDVAVALGYKDTAKALSAHVDSEDKRFVKVGEMPTLETGNYGVTIINESGLYSLILSSKLPDAKKFKHWVTSEVLPAIRKTGTYTIPPIDNINPQEAYTGAQRLGDVVELAKLTARLMKDSKRKPDDILRTVGAQLEGFGVTLPEGFYTGLFTTEASAERSKVVEGFLTEFGSVLDVSVGEVYNEYLDYCHRMGVVPISSTRAFGREVVKHTGVRTRSAYRNGRHMRVYTDE